MMTCRGRIRFATVSGPYVKECARYVKMVINNKKGDWRILTIDIKTKTNTGWSTDTQR